MMHVKYSNINQAYFLMFGDSVVNIFNSKDDLLNHLKCSGLRMAGNKVVKAR